MGVGKLAGVVLVVDLEETLVTRVTPRGLLEPGVPALLERVRDGGAHLVLCTRNPPWAAEAALGPLGVPDPFEAILADYRARDYQLKHVLLRLRKAGVVPEVVVFVDDAAENCRRVASLREELAFPLYVVCYERRPPRNLESILGCILDEDWEGLEAAADGEATG